MMFALYWDESDEWDDSVEKVRRAIYSSKEDAVAQGTHDLLCLRCRVYKDGRTTLESTGVEPLDSNGEQKCRDCNGTKLCPSKRILRVESFTEKSLKDFHASSKGVASPALNTGKVVWTPSDLKV